MKLAAQITVREGSQDLERLFKSEDKAFTNERARYTIEHREGAIIFHIEAEDSPALRAVLNSITKIITVYEKTKGVFDDEQ